MPRPQEMALLRACVRSALGDTHAPKDFADLLEKADWSHALWLARKHDVMLLLHAALKAYELRPGFAEDLLQQLDIVRETESFKRLKQGAELSRIQSLLD